jgi:transposase
VLNGPTQSDYDALRHTYEAQRSELATAQAQIVALTAEVGRLADLVAKGNERIAELLAIAQRKKRGQAPPPKPPALPPTLSEDVKKAFAERPMPPERRKKKKRPRKKAKPTGRKPLPDHLPAEEHTVTPEHCPCGGTDLESVDEVVEVKLHVVKEHLRRRVVKRKTCLCKRCGERTTARSLPAPFARSKATCEWLAWLVHMKFVMLVPLDRLRRDLASRGIDLAMSYLVTQIERAADLLGIVDGEHWKQLLHSDWMATDATGLKVLIPQVSGTHNGYLEVYRRHDLVVFQYEPHKGGEALEKLAPFSGVLVADAEHRYNDLYTSGRVIEAGCNAHGRRKLRDAESTQPVLAKEGGDFISAMYVAEDKAQTLGLRGSELKHFRQTHVPPHKEAFKDWMDAVEPTLTPTDPLAQTIRYYRNHWDALFRFVDHPEIPIDNSASEREYQQVAKMRLNCLFAGSTEGAHRAATLLGIVATCRAISVDPFGYLCWAFTRLGTHRDIYGLSAAELTPSAYARAGPQAA